MISVLVGFHEPFSGLVSLSGEVRSPEDLKQYVLRDATGTFYCGFCHQFSNKSSTNVRNHCEAKHFPNLFSYPCQICTEVFGTNIALYNHVARTHKKAKKAALTFQ